VPKLLSNEYRCCIALSRTEQTAMQATGAHLRYVVTGGRTSAGTDRTCRADRLPKFENSRMVWNYREV